MTRQTEVARAFAASKGWTVVAEFADDGISREGVANRPGYRRLLRAALTPRPAFGVLIVSEQKSLGREATETQFAIKQLAQAGVEVWSYSDRASLMRRTWTDKAMMAMRGAADEAASEDSARRTHEALRRKAERGYVTAVAPSATGTRAWSWGSTRTADRFAATWSVRWFSRKPPSCGASLTGTTRALG